MSQEKQILKYLLEGNKITPLEALHKFGCFRLGARIWDINKRIYPARVQSDLISIDKKQVAQYYFDEFPLFTNLQDLYSEGEDHLKPWWMILGIGRYSNLDEIREAYKSLALKYHPDMGGDKEKFILINKAFNEGLANLEYLREKAG